MRIYKDKDDQRWYLEFSVPGTGGLKSIAHFTNDWEQIIGWKRYNWRTFDFIKLYVEDDAMLGGYELEAALLGLGFRIRFNVRTTETGRELAQRVEDIKSGKVETISIEEAISRLGKPETEMEEHYKRVKIGECGSKQYILETENEPTTNAEERALRVKTYMDYDPKNDPRNAFLKEKQNEQEV